MILPTRIATELAYHKRLEAQGAILKKTMPYTCDQLVSFLCDALTVIRFALVVVVIVGMATASVVFDRM